MHASQLRATVNCDLGEGYSLYRMGDDERLMQTIHLANIACGFHAGDFTIMDKTVKLAQQHNVRVGAHPSLPDRQGFGRREMGMDPEELAQCFTYQVGALCGFLTRHGVQLNHIKPHGSAYGMSARDIDLARALTEVARSFKVGIVGLAGTCHQKAAEELGVPFIAEYFADLDYSAEGKLLITREHAKVAPAILRHRIMKLLNDRQITTVSGTISLPDNVSEVSICCHSDTPGAVEIATLVKEMVDKHNGGL